MGCDYYEKTYLLVIDGNRCYFREYHGQVDSDETDYDDAVLRHYDKQLEVDFNPICIYKNGEKRKFLRI